MRAETNAAIVTALAELTFAMDDIDARSLVVLSRMIDTPSSAELVEIRATASRARVALQKLRFWIEIPASDRRPRLLQYPATPEPDDNADD